MQVISTQAAQAGSRGGRAPRENTWDGACNLEASLSEVGNDVLPQCDDS